MTGGLVVSRTELVFSCQVHGLFNNASLDSEAEEPEGIRWLKEGLLWEEWTQGRIAGDGHWFDGWE